VEFGPDAAPLIYGGTYFGIVALIAAAEAMAPRRAAGASLRVRWSANLILTALDTAVIRLLIPVTSVALALFLAERGWGLLNAVELPYWLSFGLCLIALDLGRYTLHWLLHRVPALWRLHAVHHSDTDYDFTTALRFHPVEALLTVSWSLAVVAVLGPPVEALIVIECAFIVCSMFTHANLRLPPGFDAVLRRLIVTPDLHRIHHSAEVGESKANFGTILPWWDRLFGTYRASPRLGHETMMIGLAELRDPRALTVPRLLLAPFRLAPREKSTWSAGEARRGAPASRAPARGGSGSDRAPL
jgi:sterol desaturase/sphingolipid hydroxylase (fatty acid hydroxylase superfamily)